MTKCGDDIRVVYPLFQAESGGSTPTSPLQLRVGRISRDTFAQLNKLWHSRLPNCTNCFEGLCFGAEHDGLFYAVAWWSKPIAQNRLKDGDKLYELRRFAISPDAPKNTASRVLSIMVRLVKKEYPGLIRLISYQDTEVHNGTIYKAQGWKPVESSAFQSWKNRTDFNRKDQSTAVKVRWELSI